MRMPPERPPLALGSLGICTRRRSLSILIGSFVVDPGPQSSRGRYRLASWPVEPTTARHRRRRHPRSGASTCPPDRWAGVVLAIPTRSSAATMHATVIDALFEALPRRASRRCGSTSEASALQAASTATAWPSGSTCVAAIDAAGDARRRADRARRLLVRRRRLAVRRRHASRRLVRGRSAAAHRGHPRLRRCERPPTETPCGRRARPVHPAGQREPRRRSGATPSSR